MFGFIIVLLASFCFCFQNVIVRILFNEQTILGIFPTGGFVIPNLQNSFLLMFMRMVLVVPLMASFAAKLYPLTWQDIRALGNNEARPILGRSLLGGVLMFLYLALLYLSIGLIQTGIALTLFFTYPIFTSLFSWVFLGIPPTRFRWMIMVVVLVGTFLTIPYTQTTSDSYNGIGVIFGIASGLAYALYTVNAQKSFEGIHPVPFTWISFATTLGLSTLSLFIWQGDNTDLNWTPMWVGGFLSAIVTLSGHLMFNYGIKLIGATTAATIGATNPSLTAILAWLTIQETINGLQILGIVIVTIGILLLSQEHRRLL
ncbi:MAG: EamA family transporter [Okeania sp. SIO2F4]|uniref:DMT family transporter n=1 Tax=Okeania sp. SIO2F4 TaxID=2607790 RepID=UPI00142C2231|nr:DMT family transporter [Okeania sp. SIO2F4]NES01443.1 EamA family transporter [Okeania sp. SIO2F4]